MLFGSHFSKRRLCTIEVVLSHACIRTAPNFQRFLVSGNSRLKLGGIGFPQAEFVERDTEVVLGRGPIKGDPFARALFKGFLVCRHSRLEPGGAGLPLRAAAAILEQINISGCTATQCHAQMYIMGTLLRHGNEEQKKRYLPGIASGALRLQAFGVTEPTSGTVPGQPDC